MTRRVSLIFTCLLLVLLSATTLFFIPATPAKASAASGGQFELSSDLRDGKLDVTLKVTANPGITGLQFELDYDRDVLTLLTAERGSALKALSLTETKKDPIKGYEDLGYRATTTGYLTAKDTSTGVFMTFHFTVKTDAKAERTTVGLKNLKVYDGSSLSSEVKFTVKPTTVTIGSGGSGNIGLILGIVGGCLLLAGIVIAVVVYKRKKDGASETAASASSGGSSREKRKK